MWRAEMTPKKSNGISLEMRYAVNRVSYYPFSVPVLSFAILARIIND